MSRAVLDQMKKRITQALRAAEPRMRATARKQLIRSIATLANSGELTERESQQAIVHLVATNAYHEYMAARKRR